MVSLTHNKDVAMTDLSIDDTAAKMSVIRADAVHKFTRPSRSRAVKLDCASTNSGVMKDPRLLDFVYEMTFSTGAMSQDKVASLEAARHLIFALPEFKAAAERVAYSEDLLTRAVTLLEGMMRCRLCGSNNTTFTTRQMHSSDEAPTMMLLCGSCHHRTNQTGE